MKHYKFLSFLLIIPTLLTSCGKKEITKPVYEGKINHIYQEIVEKLSHIYNDHDMNNDYVFDYDESTVYHDPNEIYIYGAFGHFNNAYLVLFYFSEYYGGVWNANSCYGLLKDEYNEYPKRGVLLSYYRTRLYPAVYKDNQLYSIQTALDNKIFGNDISVLKNITNDTVVLSSSITRNNSIYSWDLRRYNLKKISDNNDDFIVPDDMFNEYDDSLLSNLYIDYLNENNILDKKIKHGKAQIGCRYINNHDMFNDLDENAAGIYSFDIPSMDISYSEDHLFTKNIGNIELKVHSNIEPVVYLPNQQKIISLEDALEQQIINQTHLEAVNKVDEFVQDGTIGAWSEVNLMSYEHLI